MLTGLAIRDFVLVRALDLDPGEGFTALTGETGAGKSILMSALSFALGARAGQGLIRPGADTASVTASFEAAKDHPVRAFLAARGVDEACDEPLVFRRMMRRGGAARAFLNDQPVSAGLLEELDALDPQEGETQRLALDRAAMQAGERVAESIDAAAHLLTKVNVEGALANAARAVSRALGAPGLTGEGAASALAVRMRAACESLERALIETGEARSVLEAASSECEFSPAALEASETRLFALRAAGRKHDVDPEQLAGLRKRLRLQLDEIEHSDGALAATLEAETKARAAFDEIVASLTARREAAASKLARAVSGELGPLKLEKAKFRVVVAPREAGPQGRDEVVFEIETNAGAGFGPLNRIASGGEMARFALAVSVCLAGSSPAGTLVFDEADMGVGGAVAAAIGERLARLGKDRQVLAITHSPQVAAAASRQLKVSKADAGGETLASVDMLTSKARKEEIARMLAGASVTKEARAAAGRLLAGT